MKAVLIAAALVVLSFGGFAERSATISVDWRGLPNVEGILREDSKAHYGFANFIAYGPRWEYMAQDYAATEQRKTAIEDPVLGKGMLFTARLRAGKTGLDIREEYYDVTRDGKAKVHVRWTIANVESGKPMALKRAYVRFPLSRQAFAGGRMGPKLLPEEFREEFIDVGGANEVRIASRDGQRSLSVRLIAGEAVMQDARKDGKDRFEFRLAFPNLKSGSFSTIEFEIEGSLDDSIAKKEGVVKFGLPRPTVRLAANEEWVAFPFANAIRAGSILDFSNLGTRDAPAGKYGFVKVNDEGHFAFERTPRGVRFVGGNLCFDANFLTTDQCKTVVDDFVKRGWNTVRFHHLDVSITKEGWENLKVRTTCPEISPERLDRLDYLMSEFKKAGVYVTFDLYAMGSLGLCEGFDRPLNDETFRAIVPLHRPAEDRWFKRAMELFDHVNPYTGLKWKDDPAVLFVTLMNEDSVNAVWRGAADRYFAAYEKWAAVKGRGAVDRMRAEESKDFAEFLFTVKAEANRRMIGRLKAAGVRTLCAGGNWWDTMAQTYERETLEVVDNHAYGDHPQPSYQKIPFRITQASDIKGRNATYCQPLMKAPTRIFGRPFTLTEFNYCAPNRWRADGGIMMGAYASLQDWDALYRFAWSHTDGNMFTPSPIRGFDVVTDPIAQLTDRQIVLMFARRDVASAKRSAAYGVERESALSDGVGDMWSKGLFPHPFTQYAMVSRIGSYVADDGGRPAVACDRVWNSATADAIPKHNGLAVSDTDEIRIDTKNGDLTVTTPKTAAVCSVDRHDLVAGPLSVSRVTAFCSVSASAMDAAALVDSTRVLILHLTDVQNTGAEFTSEGLTCLKRWGTLPYLAHVGKANVALENRHAGLTLYALASDGSRLRAVPSVYDGRAYHFTVEIRAGVGEAAPTMMYELVSETR